MCDFCSTDLFSFQTSSPVDIKRLFSCHGSFIPYPCVVNCPTRWSLYCPLGICTPRPSSRLTLWPWSQPCGWSLTNHMADSMIKPQIKTKTMAFVMNNEWVANCDKRAVSLSCFRESKKKHCFLWKVFSDKISQKTGEMPERKNFSYRMASLTLAIKLCMGPYCMHIWDQTCFYIWWWHSVTHCVKQLLSQESFCGRNSPGNGDTLPLYCFYKILPRSIWKRGTQNILLKYRKIYLIARSWRSN